MSSRSNIEDQFYKIVANCPDSGNGNTVYCAIERISLAANLVDMAAVNLEDTPECALRPELLMISDILRSVLNSLSS